MGPPLNPLSHRPLLSSISHLPFQNKLETLSESAMKTRRRNISGERLTITQCNSLSNNSENLLPLPIDLIIEIFSRLPLKSIARCRCVSKHWSSILRSPDFTELFLSNSSSRPKLLFACRKDSELFIFSANQPQNSSHIVAKYLMKFSFDGAYEIRGLFNGLLCVLNKRISKGKKEEFVPMICNPSTGQVVCFPQTEKYRMDTAKIAFGYDPVGKHLKVLSRKPSSFVNHNVVRDHIQEYKVLTLGTEKMSWRRIKGCRLGYYPSIYLYINGVVYFRYIDRSWMILCFDVRLEKFRSVQVKEAKEALKVTDMNVTMIDYNGRLGLIRAVNPVGSFGLKGRSRGLKLLVLEDIEKQEWSEHEYLLPDVWKDLVGKESFCCIGVTRENEFVLKPLGCYPFFLIYFNHERNTVVRVEIQGLDAFKDGTVHTFLNHVEDVKFI